MKFISLNKSSHLWEAINTDIENLTFNPSLWKSINIERFLQAGLDSFGSILLETSRSNNNHERYIKFPLSTKKF